MLDAVQIPGIHDKASLTLVDARHVTLVTHLSSSQEATFAVLTRADRGLGLATDVTDVDVAS